MAKYNTKFTLDPQDMDLIETALRRTAAEVPGDAPEARELHALLGRLHDQKVFFRPRDGVYISG